MMLPLGHWSGLLWYGCGVWLVRKNIFPGSLTHMPGVCCSYRYSPDM